MLKYTYDTGKIERDFVLKKVEGSCKQDPNHTKLIGVMCRTCPFYDGEKKFYSRNSEFLHGDYLGRYILCKYHKKDDEGTKEIIWDMMDKFKEEAITHYYD